MSEKITRNFRRDEFACDNGLCDRCGGVAPINPKVVATAQAIRDELNARRGITSVADEIKLGINSGFRCKPKNRDVGGAPNSQHLHGNACDIAKPEGVTIDELSDIAEDILGPMGGAIGLYDTFIHIDIRYNGPKRWDFRGK